MIEFIHNILEYLHAPVVTLNHGDIFIIAFLGFALSFLFVGWLFEKKIQKLEKKLEKAKRNTRRETAEQYNRDADDVLEKLHAKTRLSKYSLKMITGMTTRNNTKKMGFSKPIFFFHTMAQSTVPRYFIE